MAGGPETRGLQQIMSTNDVASGVSNQSAEGGTEAKPEMTPYQKEMVLKFGTLVTAASKASEYLSNGQVISLNYEVDVVGQDGKRKKEKREFTFTAEAPDALQHGIAYMYADVMMQHPILKDAADQLLHHEQQKQTSTEVFNRWWDTPTE